MRGLLVLALVVAVLCTVDAEVNNFYYCPMCACDVSINGVVEYLVQ